MTTRDDKFRPAMSNKQRQADFKTRQQAAGMVRVSEWIPNTCREDHKAFCEILRKHAPAPG